MGSDIKFKERTGFTPRTPIKPLFSDSGPEKPRPPDPSTAFQPGGSGAKDQARREVNSELARSARVRGLQRLAGRGDRGAFEMLRSIGEDPLGGGGIQHYDDKMKQATGTYMNKAENRYDVGQVGKGGADSIEQSAQALGNGSGDSPQNAAASSSGDQWVNVGGSKTSGLDSTASTPPPALSATAPAVSAPRPASAPRTADPVKGVSGGMFDGPSSMPDRNESATPDQDAQARRESLRSSTDAAYQRLEQSRQKRIEAEKVSDAALANLDKNTAARESKIVENDKARREMIAQVAADRDVWFQDVKANVRHTGVNPDTGKESIMAPARRAFLGMRKDSPMPEVDWDQFDSRKPEDPNYGRTRYKSQYQTVNVPTQYGGTRTETQYKGEYIDPYKAPKGMRRTGIGYMPIDPSVPQKAVAKAQLEYAANSVPQSPL
jgi:hypothetical protein